MKNSFRFIKQLLDRRHKNDTNFPYQEILLTRLCLHTMTQLSEWRNNSFKQHDINETLFMTLVIIKSQDNHTIAPSELSKMLNLSKTHATRIADELETKGWIERQHNLTDRRSQLLALTDEGEAFLQSILPSQHKKLRSLWSILSKEEQKQLEQLMNKMLHHFDQA